MKKQQLFIIGLAVGLWLGIAGLLGPSSTLAVSTTLVINEIDYDQPSTDTAEFIELKNVSPDAIDLSGYTLELVNGTGGGAAVYNTIALPAVSLAPGDYFVVCANPATVANCDLDVSPDENLVQNGAPDAVGLRFGADLIDAVSYEGDTGAPYTEGSGAGLEDVGDMGLSRCPDAADTDQNNVDFSLAPITPGAANECAPPPTPTPPPPAAAKLVINEVDYDQPMTDSAEFLEIKNIDTAGVDLDPYAINLVNGSGTTVYLTIDLPAVTLSPGDYFVVCANTATVANCDLDVSPDTNLIQNGAPDAVALSLGGAVVDAVSYEGNTGAPYTEGSGTGLEDDGSAATEGISRCPDGADSQVNNVDFRLAMISPGAENTCPPPPISVRIRDIQGSAHFPSLDGQGVQNVPGIVTAVAENGFWMQDPSPDDNEATSEGIFVFTNSAPAVSVGDDVTVNGTATEFRPGGLDDGNLTITEITATSISVNSTGNPLPAPIIIGAGGRVPPSSIIEDDAAGNVETSGVFEPATDGLDFYESLEGMRVQINEALVVGPTNGFGEIWVVSDGGASAGAFTARGGLLINPPDFNPERIQLDDPLYPGDWPGLNVGARLTGPAIGVVHYGFGNFEVLVTDLFSTDASNEVSRETTGLVGSANHLTVATFNVENLGGDASSEEFAARAGQIVNHLLAPDIVVLEEMQDNDGSSAAGNPDATQTFTRLIEAIQAAGGPAYAFAQIDPVDGADGGIPGGNIRVGFLYNPARVGFTSRPGGDAATPNTVSCANGVAQLDLNPGRVDPNNPAYNDSRKPLAGEFTFNGQPVYVVGVHFSSKGGDDPLYGFTQPPVLHTEPDRIAQAQAVNDFVDSILACNAAANVVVLGDVNDFQFSPPVAALKGDALENLMDLLPADERYSYIFEGNSQVLDQIVVSHNLRDNQSPEYDVVHVNAEFEDQVSDHEPSVSRFYFNQPPDCSAASPSLDSLWPPNHQFEVVNILNITDPDGDAVAITIDGIFQDEPVDGPDDGSSAPDGQGLGAATAEVRAERDGSGNGRFYHITFTAADGNGGACSAEVLVSVPLNQGQEDETIDDGPLFDSTVTP